MLFRSVSAVRKVTRLPIIPKLTPNVTDVASFARAAEEAVLGGDKLGRARARVQIEAEVWDGAVKSGGGPGACTRESRRVGGPLRALVEVSQRAVGRFLVGQRQRRQCVQQSQENGDNKKARLHLVDVGHGVF